MATSHASILAVRQASRTQRRPIAQRVSVSITGHLDGSEAADTITFGLDGTSYEIDLNEKSGAAVRKAVNKYVASARRSSGRGTGRTRARGRRPARSGDADPKGRARLGP